VASQPVRGGYLYTLANFTGPVRDNFSRVIADKERKEIYVLYQNTVRVFNDSGMEIYRFGDDLDLGHIVDVAVDREGDILLLTYRDTRSAIVRCNYRGEPKATVELKNVPAEFSEFSPNRMIYQQDTLYVASLSTMKLVIANREGNFKKGYDLISLFELEEKDRGNVELSGFSVDAVGNILMTVPVLFRAYILSPDGALTSFGKPGGAPGRFNIAAGIARDSKGNYLVVDRLKGSVMVFDKNFNFVTQFGFRGYGPSDLIFPDDIAVDNGDRVYVTQMGRRGVSVYKLSYN
jgi:sugar lactone lactonase YvrE